MYILLVQFIIITYIYLYIYIFIYLKHMLIKTLKSDTNKAIVEIKYILRNIRLFVIYYLSCALI
jgi:hypothetical protein